MVSKMPRTKAKEKLILVSFHIPKQMLEKLDDLVKKVLFPSRSEAIRLAIFELLQKYGNSNGKNIGDVLVIEGGRNV